MPTRRQVLLSAGALLGSNGRVLAAAGSNMLQLRVEYSATSVIGTDALAVPGRLWRTRSALRYEGTQHGRALTAIARLDRNLGWLVMAASRLAIETDLSALDLPLDVLTGSGSLGQVREVRERVNGLDTTRIRVERSHGTRIRFKGHVWATDQGVIARLAGEGESNGRRGRTLMNSATCKSDRSIPAFSRRHAVSRWFTSKVPTSRRCSRAWRQQDSSPRGDEPRGRQ